MIAAILACAFVQVSEPPTPTPPGPAVPVATTPIESAPATPTARADQIAKPGQAVIFHLGSNRSVTGPILKETADAAFVDVGFEVVRVPLESVVRREIVGAKETVESGSSRELGIYFTATRRPEKSIAAGAAEVSESVIKIETPTGSGSGFITHPDGYCVSNFHVVDGETEVSVVLFLKDASSQSLDKRTIRNCKVVAINPAIDLALVKFDPPEGVKLGHVFLGDSGAVRVGDRAYAIGAPIGLDRTVSSGIVSVTNRTYDGHTRLQMTVPINPGNSGGPLFNLRGEVIGVNSSGYLSRQGLNFAIPSKYVIDFLENRDAFALDSTRSENGVHYLPAPRKPSADSEHADAGDDEKSHSGR